MKAGMEWKVGLFVLIGLGLLGALILNFSKGVTFTQSTYDVFLRSSDIGGLKRRAGVLMAGVPVGTVHDATLAPDGKSVSIRLRIHDRFVIHGDALFAIEQSGFLGDQYVAIIPRQNELPPLQHGEEVRCEPPFNLQEVARSAAGLLQRVDLTARRLSDAVERVDRSLLAEENLAAISMTVTNIRSLSERAATTLDNLDGVVRTNAPVVSAALADFSAFARGLTNVSEQLQQIVDTNRTGVAEAVRNVEAASTIVKELLGDLQQGKGLAGSLLKDAELQSEMKTLMDNLVTLSSNLNRYGLLYKPKAPRPASAASTEPVYPGRSPFR
jgi:phospholipid/cholesterol/gamma-HCH transport system substrate-binding protein